MEKELNYSEAYNELSKIVSEIENNTISIDELSNKVKRANYLIEICNNKLLAIENEVKESVNKVEE